MKRIFKDEEAGTALSLYAFGFDATQKADFVNLHIKGKIDGEWVEATDIEISVELINVNEKLELIKPHLDSVE
jgi:hypothetical protein